MGWADAPVLGGFGAALAAGGVAAWWSLRQAGQEEPTDRQLALLA